VTYEHLWTYVSVCGARSWGKGGIFVGKGGDLGCVWLPVLRSMPRFSRQRKNIPENKRTYRTACAVMTKSRAARKFSPHRAAFDRRTDVWRENNRGCGASLWPSHTDFEYRRYPHNSVGLCGWCQPRFFWGSLTIAMLTSGKDENKCLFWQSRPGSENLGHLGRLCRITSELICLIFVPKVQTFTQFSRIPLTSCAALFPNGVNRDRRRWRQ
jgi:hypothetical protein